MERTSSDTVLDRLLDPLARCLTPAAAQAVVDFRADASTQQRIQELADKCNEGQLTSAERAEYESYVRTIDFIAVLQSKARRLLAQNRLDKAIAGADHVVIAPSSYSSANGLPIPR